jgi:hypothetical protein
MNYLDNRVKIKFFKQIIWQLRRATGRDGGDGFFDTNQIPLKWRQSSGTFHSGAFYPFTNLCLIRVLLWLKRI